MAHRNKKMQEFTDKILRTEIDPPKANVPAAESTGINRPQSHTADELTGGSTHLMEMAEGGYYSLPYAIQRSAKEGNPFEVTQSKVNPNKIIPPKSKPVAKKPVVKKATKSKGKLMEKKMSIKKQTGRKRIMEAKMQKRVVGFSK